MSRLRLARYFRRRVLRRRGAEVREQQAIELVGKCREQSDRLPRDGFSLVTRLDLARVKGELEMLAADCGGIVDRIRSGQPSITAPLKRRFARILNSLQQASVRDRAWIEAASKLRQRFRDALKRSAILDAVRRDRRQYYEKAFQIRLEEASRSRDPDAALASADRILRRLEEEAELPDRVMSRTRIVSNRVQALEEVAERFDPLRPDCDEATTLMKRADRHQLVRFAVVCGMTGQAPHLLIEQDSNSSAEEVPPVREPKKKPRRPPRKHVYEDGTPVCASCGGVLKRAMLVWEPTKRFCRSCRLARRSASARDTGPKGNA